MHSNIYQTKLFTYKSIGQLLLIPAAFFLTLTFVLLRPSPALADGGISVTTTDDEYSDPGPGDGCSLREAIQSANDDSDFGGCARSGTAPYTITVPAAIYTLTIPSTNENDNADGDLDLQASMTIEGAGAGQTIIQAGPDASSGIDRIFDVRVDGLTINLSHLTIRHGNADSGGGIEHYGDGSLTVTDCAITDNKAYSAQGGGIFVTDGTVTINNSTVSNNMSYSSGGGLAIPGTTRNPTLSVNNSTISGNTAESNGGGGIRLQGGTLNIASSTIVSNTALGGYPGRGGGGIRTTVSPNPSIKNSIIANNSADGVPGPDCQGTISSGGYNLIEDTTDCGGTVGTDITGQDPILGPLVNNGGDTETHALLTGSPAIDAANPSGCTDVDGAPLTTDQRGRFRAYDANTTCDIGAVEAQPDIMVLDSSVTVRDGTGSVDFGVTPMGTPVDKTFTISNTGAFTLTLTEPISVPTGFSVAGSFADTSLAPGDTTTFTIRLDAALVGIYSGTLQFNNNDTDESPFDFTIRGEADEQEIAVFSDGIAIPDGTGSVDFGLTPVGTPVDKTFTISNTGLLTLTLTEPITVPTGFSVAGSFADTSVAPGDATTFTIRLNAASISIYSGTLQFGNNDADESPFDFTIRGEADEQEIAVFSDGIGIPDGTGSVDFGVTPMGTPVDKTFAISNTGGYTLTLTEPITVPTGFSVAGSFAGTSVAPGDTTTFTIRLDAASVGIYSGTLKFTNNDVDENPYNFTVIGKTESVYYFPIIFKSQ